MILEIRRERTVELALEGLRYPDLLRWAAGKAYERFVRYVFPRKRRMIGTLTGNPKYASIPAPSPQPQLHSYIR